MALIFKLLYSVILLGLSGIILRELWMVWFDTTVYVGRFDVITDAGKDEAASAAFPARIVTAQLILSEQITDYLTRRTADAPSDATFILPGSQPLLLPRDELGGMDVTIQSVNIRQVLTALRRGFLAPNEVTGRVSNSRNAVLATVEWPRAPQLGQESIDFRRFLVQGKTTEQSAAAVVACNISWARVASRNMAVAGYAKAQFCDFGEALGELYALVNKASTASGLDGDEVHRVRQYASQLRSHYGASQVFPEIYRLRADLLDLLPETARRQSELVDAQDDRLRYAMLSPKLSALDPEEREHFALALARPAFRISNGELIDKAENWNRILDRYKGAIHDQSASVGLLKDEKNQPIGTAFLVAPRLIMAARQSLDAGGYRFRPPPASDCAWQVRRPAGAMTLEIAGSEPTVWTLGDVIFAGTGDSKVVLVDVPSDTSSDLVAREPLAFSQPLPPANTLIGQYAYVIGYPFEDHRLPPAFVKHLLNGNPGVERLMPGRVHAVGPSRFSVASTRPLDLTTDISTAGGVMGAPLIQMSSGRVIGLSHSGTWKEGRGKFAYAEAISDEALAAVARRLSGKDDQPNVIMVGDVSADDDKAKPSGDDAAHCMIVGAPAAAEAPDNEADGQPHPAVE